MNTPAELYTVGQRFQFTRGQKVICNGYPGSIYNVETGTLEGMVSVRLRSGMVCVSATYPEVYPSNGDN